MSWRRFCKTSWRRLENVLKTSWQDVLKTSWKHLEDVLKTYGQDEYIGLDQDVFWRREAKANKIRLDEDVFWGRRRKRSSRRLHQDECLLGSYLPLLMRSCFPASTPRGFCLIRCSILIGCFNKIVCLVKYIVLWQKLWRVRKLFLSSHFATKERAIFENKFFTTFFIIFSKTNDSKKVYTVEARLCFPFF